MKFEKHCPTPSHCADLMVVLPIADGTTFISIRAR